MQDISKGGGRTVLFVSHNMASVQKLCTRGVLLENGGIKFEGSIVEIVDQYLSKYQDLSIKHQAVQNYKLSDLVIINQISFSKAFVKPFESFDLMLDIESKELNSYDGIALLIYDNNENRIAVIDLRDGEFLNKSSMRIIIEAKIEVQTLLSKEYVVGLAIGSKLFTSNVYNLFKFTVLEHENLNEINSYPLSVMGQTFIKSRNLNIIKS